MNVHDSQRMRDLLLERGLSAAPGPDQADVIVVNTCSVREKAEQKLDSQLGKFRLLKQHRAQQAPLLVVAGCVARQRAAALLKRMPFVDVVLGPDTIGQLPDIVERASDTVEPIVDVSLDLDHPTFLADRGVGPSTPTSFVAISKGCDQRCSFCIVPQTRGPERHRPANEIIDEIQGVVDRGSSEVVLLGQTVNRYEDPSGVLGTRPDGLRSDFGPLLYEIAARVPGLKRLRYTSPHPVYYDAAVVKAHRDLDMLCRHVHMPVQSGSDAVLKRMVRRYTREQFLAAVDALRDVQPDLTISTDIIVGFPGETDDDFEQTISIMHRARFFGVYAFKYSPRPGTAALAWGDTVDEHAKSERLARIFEVSEALQHQHLQNLVGSTQNVLIEGLSPRGDGGLMGHTIRNEIVHLDPRSGLSSDAGVLTVRISEAYRHSLKGELVDHLPTQGVTTKRQLPVVSPQSNRS